MAEASIYDMALFALFDGCNIRGLAKVAGLSRPQAAGAVGPLRVLAKAVRACSDLHVQAADAYACAASDPAGMSRNAMRRVEMAAEDAHEAIGHVLQALRSMMRTAPKVD